MLDILIGRGQNGQDSRDKVGLGSIRRPVIGLALGGGAARGFAHIGIIRTLTAHGIVPNVVVGTSIGAVVGGAYAAGHLDTLEDWARSLQPRNILGYLDIRLNGSGLIGGDKLAAQLEAAIGQTLDHAQRERGAPDTAAGQTQGRYVFQFVDLVVVGDDLVGRRCSRRGTNCRSRRRSSKANAPFSDRVQFFQ